MEVPPGLLGPTHSMTVCSTPTCASPSPAPSRLLPAPQRQWLPSSPHLRVGSVSRICGWPEQELSARVDLPRTSGDPSARAGVPEESVCPKVGRGVASFVHLTPLLHMASQFFLERQVLFRARCQGGRHSQAVLCWMRPFVSHLPGRQGGGSVYGASSAGGQCSLCLHPRSVRGLEGFCGGSSSALAWAFGLTMCDAARHLALGLAFLGLVLAWQCAALTLSLVWDKLDLGF